MTVAAPITAKFAAVPSGTGVAVAAVAAPADPVTPISNPVAATARTVIAASRNDVVILRIMPVMVVTMGFNFRMAEPLRRTPILNSPRK
jgi:hypothetical protein